MPFRKIVQASQPGAVMSSYNEINGVPSAANTYLIDTLMRADVRLPGLLHRRLRRGQPRSTRGITGSRPASGTSRPSSSSSRSRSAAGEDAECNAGYNGSGNYRGPTAPSTTPGGR